MQALVLSVLSFAAKAGAAQKDDPKRHVTIDRTIGFLMQTSSHPIFPDSPVPLYSQLADLLRQRVLRGMWGPGTKVPSLEAMVAEFKVARVTVRQAIDILTREGLLLPQRGRGTFVTEQVRTERSLTLETSLRGLADAYRNDKPKLTLLEEAGVQPRSQHWTAKQHPPTTTCAGCIRATARPIARHLSLSTSACSGRRPSAFARKPWFQ